MLGTELQEPPTTTTTTAPAVEPRRGASKWYVGGLWPFQRISFECPGCGRWLSTRVACSDRVGNCPHCTQAMRAPDVADYRPASLVAGLGRIRTLPKRRLPSNRAPTGKSGMQPIAVQRFVVDSDEGQWGVGNRSRNARLSVVKRFQSVTPWLWVAGVMACAVMIFQVFLANHSSAQPTALPPTAMASSRSDAGAGDALWVMMDALGTAKTSRQVLALVRDQERVQTKLMDYYAAHPEIELPHVFQRTRPYPTIVEVDGKKFARFNGRCDGRPVKFSFESTPHGWRLDWESMVGYADGNWVKYLSDRPGGEHVFRVIVSVSGGDGTGLDRERYTALKMVDHLGGAEIDALLDRGGEVEATLEKFLSKSRVKRVPRTWITPVLSWDPGGKRLHVVALKSASWLVP